MNWQKQLPTAINKYWIAHRNKINSSHSEGVRVSLLLSIFIGKRCCVQKCLLIHYAIHRKYSLAWVNKCAHKIYYCFNNNRNSWDNFVTKYSCHLSHILCCAKHIFAVMCETYQIPSFAFCGYPTYTSNQFNKIPIINYITTATLDWEIDMCFRMSAGFF